MIHSINISKMPLTFLSLNIKAPCRLLLLFLLLASLFTSCISAFPVPSPKKYEWKLLGLKPVSVSADPLSALKTAEPFLYKTTNTIIKYKEPSAPSREPNRLLTYSANTKLYVDQNGLPWSRPPSPGNVDMEKFLDERHYARFEAMIKSGEIIVDPTTKKLLYADSLDPVDLEYGTDMLSMVGKDNGIEAGNDGMTVYERYMNGLVDVERQSLFGVDIPEQMEDEWELRKAYGLGPPPSKESRKVSEA
ncbi:hypothetical protein BDZ91DRAFT_2447 [Kalaharituber pfeilii]|nr:hypothetical protein BDZ91DRAFT_2447 [Kalaharituber pfeilii]